MSTKVVNLDKLRMLWKTEVSYTQIGIQLGLTKGQVAGLVRRHCKGLTTRGVRKREVRVRGKFSHIWTDAALTEPWKEYTARKRAERQAAKNRG